VCNPRRGARALLPRARAAARTAAQHVVVPRQRVVTKREELRRLNRGAAGGVACAFVAFVASAAAAAPAAAALPRAGAAGRLRAVARAGA
jgi:hypothetical protein